MLASADGQVELTDEEMRQRPLIRIKPSNEWQWTEERQKAASNNAFVPCPTIRQFPASVQLANQMAEGKISSFRAPWRSNAAASTTRTPRTPLVHAAAHQPHTALHSLLSSLLLSAPS